jgi:hypothetical protein
LLWKPPDRFGVGCLRGNPHLVGVMELRQIDSGFSTASVPTSQNLVPQTGSLWQESPWDKVGFLSPGTGAEGGLIFPSSLSWWITRCCGSAGQSCTMSSPLLFPYFPSTRVERMVGTGVCPIISAHLGCGLVSHQGLGRRPTPHAPPFPCLAPGRSCAPLANS